MTQLPGGPAPGPTTWTEKCNVNSIKQVINISDTNKDGILTKQELDIFNQNRASTMSLMERGISPANPQHILVDTNAVNFLNENFRSIANVTDEKNKELANQDKTIRLDNIDALSKKDGNSKDLSTNDILFKNRELLGGRTKKPKTPPIDQKSAFLQMLMKFLNSFMSRFNKFSQFQ